MTPNLVATLFLILSAPTPAATDGAAQPTEPSPPASTVTASPAVSNPAIAEPSERMRRRVLREEAVMQDPALRQDFLRSRSLGRAGIVVGSVGLTAGLLVSLPLRWRYRAALEKADDQVYRAGLEQPLLDAQRRRRAFHLSLAAAGGVTVLGTTLAIVGYTRRARILRSTDTRFTASPAVGGGHYGMSAVLRF